MQTLLILLDSIVSIITWVVIINVAFSWLIFFQVVNPNNQIVGMIYNSTQQLLSPLLEPIRRLLMRFLPNMGGIDISPVILLLCLWFVRNLIFEFSQGL